MLALIAVTADGWKGAKARRPIDENLAFSCTTTPLYSRFQLGGTQSQITASDNALSNTGVLAAMKQTASK